MNDFKKPSLIWLTWKHWHPIKCRPVLIIPESLDHAYVIPGTSSHQENDSVCINIENTQDNSTKATYLLPKQGLRYCIKCLKKEITEENSLGEDESSAHNLEEFGLDLEEMIQKTRENLQNHCVCPLKPLQVGDTIFHNDLRLYGVAMEIKDGKIRWIILDDENKVGHKVSPTHENKLPRKLHFNGYYSSQFNRDEFKKIGRLDNVTKIRLQVIAKRSKFFG